jgi:hypothetical protein
LAIHASSATTKIVSYFSLNLLIWSTLKVKKIDFLRFHTQVWWLKNTPSI